MEWMVYRTVYTDKYTSMCKIEQPQLRFLYRPPDKTTAKSVDLFQNILFSHFLSLIFFRSIYLSACLSFLSFSRLSYLSEDQCDSQARCMQ